MSQSKTIFKFNGYDYIASDPEFTLETGEDGELWIRLEVSASIDDEESGLDFEICDLRLYHENGFRAHVSDYKELAGKKFIWHEEINEHDEDAGWFYVLEHEDVTSGIIEIMEIDEENVHFRWTGEANVGWDDPFASDVPFDVEISCPITWNI